MARCSTVLIFFLLYASLLMSFALAHSSAAARKVVSPAKHMAPAKAPVASPKVASPVPAPAVTSGAHLNTYSIAGCLAALFVALLNL